MEPNHNTTIQQILSQRWRKRNAQKIRLQMTPMIDVIFLLLTFFVLTAKFRLPEDFLFLRLPKASTQTAGFNVVEPLTVRIMANANGCVVEIAGSETITIENTAIEAGLGDFAEKLMAISQKQKRTAADPVEIECANNVNWDMLAKIYNVMYSMDISDITFIMNE